MVSLKSYSNKVEYYKKLEQSRLWAKEEPTDFQDESVTCKLNNTKGIDEIAKAENQIYINQLLSGIKKDAYKYIMFIIKEALIDENHESIKVIKMLSDTYSDFNKVLYELLHLDLTNALNKIL